jgi:hypothetical protein
MKFHQLKYHIQRHLDSDKHKELSEVSSSLKKEGRLNKIGMLLSAIAYEIIFHGHSFRDYEKRVAILDMNGVDVGNLNHSRDFLTRFLNTIYDRVSNFVNLPISKL